MRLCRSLIVTLLAVATVAAGQSPAPRALQVVWRVGGNGDDTSFAHISAIAVSATGDVVVWDRQSSALRLYNDAGKFVRTIGHKGAGPGEFDGISGMAYGTDGRFYVWDSGNARLNVYKSNGDFDKQMRLPISSFSTSNGLSIDTEGRAWFRFVIFDRAGGKTQGAWIRMRTSDGVTLDTVKMPAFEGSDPQLVARAGGAMASYNMPYGKYPSYALTASGELMTAPGGGYEVNLPYRGKVVKVQRPYTPIRVSGDERTRITESLERSLRQTQPDWTWPMSVPSVKPAFQSIAGALDGRVWVALNVESEKYTPDPPASAAPTAPPPRPAFRDANRRWDVFEADGRYAGTVTAPRTVDPRVMRGDFAWGIAVDEDDVPTLVKLKIVPGFASK